MPWHWLLLGMLGFAVGFWLSWRHHRRRLQGRVNKVVAEEVARAIEARLLNELRHGSAHKPGASNE